MVTGRVAGEKGMGWMMTKQVKATRVNLGNYSFGGGKPNQTKERSNQPWNQPTNHGTNQPTNQPTSGYSAQSHTSDVSKSVFRKAGPLLPFKGSRTTNHQSRCRAVVGNVLQIITMTFYRSDPSLHVPPPSDMSVLVLIGGKSTQQVSEI